MIPEQKNMRAQAGFTLVELAIVMIIIGLLIAGVLKGQQLIGNAKVTAQVAQVKSIDAATSTFKDMYAALPGDISNASTRLPNCGAAPCATNGNGDGSVQGPLTFGAGPCWRATNVFRASERCRFDDRHQPRAWGCCLGRAKAAKQDQWRD
jgi:prepilin-type N-terminal cleavage/methylation domain-containing protein